MINLLEYHQGNLPDDTLVRRVVTRLANFHENHNRALKFTAAINGATLK